MKPWGKCAVACIVLGVTTSAFAEIPSDGLLNDVSDRFLSQSATWGVTITRYASWLFWVLATISMVWTFGLMALRKADIGEFFSEFVRFTVTTGFFWWLLANGPAMAMAIVNSLRRIGAEAGGLPNSLEPSTPVSLGFDVVRKAFDGLSWVHPIDNLAIVLISAAIVLCMAVVAANIMIALVTAWTMAYAGVFILGFGGARWTSDLAIAYFKAMLGIGLELLTITLMVGIATSVIDGFYNRVNGKSVYELLLVFCVCAVLALLISKIPARVAALGGGGSGANVGAGSVLGTAAMGAAALATAGSSIAAGAAGLAGGAQALTAAFSKAAAAASNDGASGDGSSNLMGGGSSFAPGNDLNSSGSGGAGRSPLASAMGDSDANSDATTGLSKSSGFDSSSASAGSGSHRKESAKQPSATSKAKDAAKVAGKVAVGTVGNLAQGSWDLAKEKIADRIENTTGGKIAAAIKARTKSAEGDSDKHSFNDDSLSAGSNVADAVAEVAAFRDRKSSAS